MDPKILSEVVDLKTETKVEADKVAPIETKVKVKVEAKVAPIETKVEVKVKAKVTPIKTKVEVKSEVLIKTKVEVKVQVKIVVQAAV